MLSKTLATKSIKHVGLNAVPLGLGIGITIIVLYAICLLIIKFHQIPLPRQIRFYQGRYISTILIRHLQNFYFFATKITSSFVTGGFGITNRYRFRRNSSLTIYTIYNRAQFSVFFILHLQHQANQILLLKQEYIDALLAKKL